MSRPPVPKIAPNVLTAPTTHPATVAATSPHGVADPAAGRASRPGRRGVAVRFARASLLIGLAALTGWNATRSASLAEAREAESRDDLPNAIRAALDHLDRRPWSREASLVAARCLSRLDHAEEAEPYYRRAWGLSFEDLHHRAYGLLRANLRDRSDAAYREILAGRPDDLTSLRIMAGVQLARNRWEDALAVADRLIAIPPGAVPALQPIAVGGHWALKPETVGSPAAIGYALRGMVSHDDFWPESAAIEFERALRADPEFRSITLSRPLFWAHLAEDLLASGRAADCRDYLIRATRDVDDPALWDFLGRAYRQSGAIEDADRSWRRALERDPRHLASLINLATCEMDRGRLAEAIGLLLRAIEVDPSSYPTTYNLSLAYRHVGRLGDAKRLEEKAMRLRRGSDKDTRAFVSPDQATP